MTEVSGNAQQTEAPSIAEAKDNKAGVPEHVTPQPPAENIIAKEEKVEYRDQDGKILNEEEVAALEGQVSFKTRYETRTRVVDANGKEIDDGGPAGAEGFAPPHPDVDRHAETLPEDPEDDKRAYPATASPEDDIGKEKSVEGKGKKAAKPASEGGKATKGEL